MEIKRGKQGGALKTVVYGAEGIGKSTFASQFPEPLFIDTEGSTKFMDVARTPAPSSWAMLMEQLEYVRTHPSLCKTLVLDTGDWAEMLCITSICASYQKKGIEDFGYGKGYVYLGESFGKLLNKLEEIVSVGVHVVVNAHAKMRKFEQPDEMGAYDRWELKLSKTTAPLLKEWADLILFANYKTFVINVDDQGASKGKNKAQGGKRVMYTTHHPCWDAKNRHGLKEELPFDFGEIAHIILGNTANAQVSPVAGSEPEVEIQREVPAPAEEKPPQPSEEYKGIPPELLALMEPAKISPEEIREIVAAKGYFPLSTPIENYPLDFVQGVLIGAWEQVRGAIEANPNRLPF